MHWSEPRFTWPLALLLASAAPAAGQSPGQIRHGVAGKMASARPADEGVLVVEFERFVNGQALVGADFDELFTLSTSGPNAGPAIFDSTPAGPNDPGPDPDLMVGKGNLLILQDGCCTSQTTPGVFDLPTDSRDGGTFTFRFARPVWLESIDLVDVDPGGGYLTATLLDASGRTRTYFVPDGYTADLNLDGPPGFARLDLRTLDVQPGWVEAATVSEQDGFDPQDVVELEVFATGSVGLDRLAFRQVAAALAFPQRTYPAAVAGMATTDVDADGHLDLVLTDHERNAILIHRNPGDGNLLPAELVPTLDDPRGLAAADLNGDGAVDLAVTGSRDGLALMSVHFNTGDGSYPQSTEVSLFRDSPVHAVNNRPDSLVAADLNGDGRVDLATGPGGTQSLNSGFVEVFLNQGGGSFDLFWAISIHATDVSGVNEFVAGDYDGDGKTDLALPAFRAEEIWIWPSGSGWGRVAHPLGFRPQRAAAEDMDGDGDVDLVVIGQYLAVLENRGGGDFAPPVRLGFYNARGHSVALFDGDGDEDPDIWIGVSTGFSAGYVIQLENTGGLSFARRVNPGSVVIVPWYLRGADLDRDGDEDLIVGERFSCAGAHVLRNRGDGTFPVRDRPRIGGRALEIDDLNEDGHADLLIANTLRSEIAVLLGDSTGRFPTSVRSPFVGNVSEVLLADFDSDGVRDLFVAAGGAFYMRGLGGGSFADAVEVWELPYDPGQSLSTTDATAADWDGDGDLDVALTLGEHTPVGGLAVLENVGGGSFVESRAYVEVDGHFLSIVHGDWDRDGDPDLAVTRRFEDDNGLTLYSNDGHGLFVEGASMRIPHGGTFPTGDLVAADLDRDGWQDLAYTGSEFGLAVFRNRMGTFRFGPVYPDCAEGRISTADVDGDGFTDLLVARTGGVAVLRNAGDGTFPVREDFAAGQLASQVRGGDLNGDGRTDLVVLEPNWRMHVLLQGP